MGDFIAHILVCGCEISDGKFTKACPGHLKRGSKVGGSIWGPNGI